MGTKQVMDWRARSYVLGRGKDGMEHAYCYCGKRFHYLASGTSGRPDRVDIPARALVRCKARQEVVSVHHNHPLASPLSIPDLSLLGFYPGIVEIVAHTSIAGLFSARRNSRWRTTWTARFRKLQTAFAFQIIAMPWACPMMEAHAFCLVLHKAQLINYEFKLDKRLAALYHKNQSSVNSFVVLVGSILEPV